MELKYEEGSGQVFFGSRKRLRQLRRWHKRVRNTYRLEITNRGDTCDGCRLDATDCRSAKSMVGPKRE